MGIRLRKCLLLFMGLLYLMGCGKEEGSQAPVGQETIVSTGAEEELFINEILTLQFNDQNMESQGKKCFYDTYANKLYILWVYQGEEDTSEELSLYIFDGETKEMEQLPFAIQIPDREGSNIQSMDVRDGIQISFRMRDNAGDFLIITDTEGKIIAQQETFPNQEEYPWNADMLHRFENRMYDTGKGSIILCCCREQENVTELFLYDAETGNKTPLSVFDGELVRALCIDDEDTIYYTTLESLNRWDKRNDTHTKLLELHENGLSSSPVSNNLLINSLGEVLVCELERDIPCVYVLSGEESHKEDVLRIAYLTVIGSDNLARPAKIFFQSYPELELVQERCENESDRPTIRDRVFMELAAGKGPELMWVQEEDMHVLQEKGLLMDLSELIPEDIQAQIVPAVIQSGTLNNQLVGIKLYAIYDTLFVSDALWEGDSWTRQDVLEIMESREEWNPVLNYNGYAMDPYELLSKVLLTDLDGSEFLDMEQGYCNFDNPEFIRLLEVCKKYGQKQSEKLNREEHSRQLKEGDSIAWGGAVTLRDFSSYMNMYNDNAHIVGYPTREGGKNYIQANNTFLVVNAQAVHLDEIKGLLAYLLSYDEQFTYSDATIREDVMRNSVVYHEFLKKYVLKISAKEDSIMDIDLKPDGTSWLEEYLAFVETCELAQNWRYTMVGTILSEELQPYFAEDKSAEEVVAIIQSRVQLYLDESK